MQDAARLQALQESGLLDAPSHERFDRLTRLAVRTLAAPVSLVTLVDTDRQVLLSQQGFEGPMAEAGETPLSYSFCQHVVRSAAPFVVPDAREEPLVRDSPSIDELGIVAYAGVPLTTPEGHTLGALCVVVGEPRAWAPEDVDALEDLAALVLHEVLTPPPAEADREATRDLAHELRPPLHAVLDLTEELASRDRAAVEELRLIDRATRDALVMLDRHLDPVQTPAGDELLRLRPVAPAEILRTLQQLPAPDAHGAELVVEDATGLPDVETDVRKVTQVLANLVTSALERPGSGEVRVRAELTRAGDALAFIVRDGGRGGAGGLPQRLRGRFQPGGGPGRGLAPAQDLARALGGVVELAPQRDGEGTRFVLTIPLVSAHDPGGEHGRPPAEVAELLDVADRRDAQAYLRDLAALDRDEAAVLRDVGAEREDADQGRAAGAGRITGGELVLRAADDRKRALRHRTGGREGPRAGRP